MLKRSQFSWIFILSKRFGNKYKHTELALNFPQKHFNEKNHITPLF